MIVYEEEFRSQEPGRGWGDGEMGRWGDEEFC
jgi:hypothetical protein